MLPDALPAQLELRRRPEGGPVMYQRWRDLLFLHWRVDPDLIARTLPEGLTVESFDGSAWLGVVPFEMCGVRPRFLPAVPGLSRFLEMNFRTYVVGPDGAPGVWFYSLDANQGLAVEVARRWFHLPYEHARMASRVEDGGVIRYTSRRRGAAADTASRFRYRPHGEIREAQPGTLEFFLLERYLLFAHDFRRTRTFTGRVHHTPYPFRDAELLEFDANLVALDGFPPIGGPPDHVACSAGVDVEVFPLRAT